MKIARNIEALEKKLAKPEPDHKVDGIADFLSNGLEHGSDEDAVYHLTHEYGLRHDVAMKLVTEYEKVYGSSLRIPSSHELTDWISHRISSVKKAYETTPAEWRKALHSNQEMLKKMEQDLRDLEAGRAVDSHLSIENAKKNIHSLKQCIQNIENLLGQ